MYVCLYTFSALCCYFFIHFSIPKYELPLEQLLAGENIQEINRSYTF